ncbi:hypothetical protein [Actinoplanes derwentensis]|nr:hypothetical protein [Actinoplanes derwentensis]GID90520.1 hypothetical protein Ade03nite_94440 [Actinoplanes derwentensis]
MSALRSDFGKLKFKRFNEFKGDQLCSAAMELADQVAAGRISHSGDELLTTQLLSAARLNVGDGWRFGRKGDIDCDSSYALSFAVRLARSIPESQGLRVVTLDDEAA